MSVSHYFEYMSLIFSVCSKVTVMTGQEQESSPLEHKWPSGLFHQRFWFRMHYYKSLVLNCWRETISPRYLDMIFSLFNSLIIYPKMIHSQWYTHNCFQIHAFKVLLLVLSFILIISDWCYLKYTELCEELRLITTLEFLHCCFIQGILAELFLISLHLNIPKSFMLFFVVAVSNLMGQLWRGTKFLSHSAKYRVILRWAEPKDNHVC